tara:strand:+ start:2044 stop:2223 length:180 start_codon:yes stop_codon:yes gene_type:complete
MIDRYKILFSELDLLEYQLKDKCKIKHGRDIAFKLMLKRKTFVVPETFIKILGDKHGKK